MKKTRSFSVFLILFIFCVPTVFGMGTVVLASAAGLLGLVSAAGALMSVVATAFTVPVVYHTYPIVTSYAYHKLTVNQENLTNGILASNFDNTTYSTYLRCRYKNETYWALEINNKWAEVKGRWGITEFQTPNGSSQYDLFLTTEDYESLKQKCLRSYEYWYKKSIYQSKDDVTPFAANNQYQRYPIIFYKYVKQDKWLEVDESKTTDSLLTFIEDSLDLMIKNKKLKPTALEFQEALRAGVGQGTSNVTTLGILAGSMEKEVKKIQKEYEAFVKNNNGKEPGAVK